MAQKGRKASESGGKGGAQKPEPKTLDTGHRTLNTEPKPPGPAGGWFAALSLETSYSKPPSQEDMEYLAKAKTRVLSSSIPEIRKRQILGYIRLGEEQKGGRFSVVQAEAVVNDYLDGKSNDVNMDFEMRLMDAWCGGKMKEFISMERESLGSRELPSEEKEALLKMLDLAQTRSKELMAVCVSSLRVYYPMKEAKERLQILLDAIDTLEGASPA